MKQVTLALSVILLALVSPGMSMAKMHEMEWRHAHEGYTHLVLSEADELKLTDEQLGKIMRVRLQHKKTYREIMKKMHESMSEEYKDFLNPSTEDAVIRKVAKERAAAFDQLVEEALKERDEVNAVLTPEQKKQLESVVTTWGKSKKGEEGSKKGL